MLQNSSAITPNWFNKLQKLKFSPTPNEEVGERSLLGAKEVEWEGFDDLYFTKYTDQQLDTDFILENCGTTTTISNGDQAVSIDQLNQELVNYNPKIEGAGGITVKDVVNNEQQLVLTPALVIPGVLALGNGMTFVFGEKDCDNRNGGNLPISIQFPISFVNKPICTLLCVQYNHFVEDPQRYANLIATEHVLSVTNTYATINSYWDKGGSPSPPSNYVVYYSFFGLTN
jgi:hypothetical protein